MRARRRASQGIKQNGPPQGEARSCFHSERDMTLFVVALIVAFTVTAATRFRDAPDIAYLVPAANHTSHGTFNLAAPGFELNFIERHTVSARANLLGIATIVEVDIREAAIMRFIPNRPATGPNRLPFGLSVIVAIVIVVAVIAIPLVTACAIAN